MIDYVEYKKSIKKDFEREKQSIKFLYILSMATILPILYYYAYKDNVLWYHIIMFECMIAFFLTMAYYMHLGDIETTLENKISRIDEKIRDESLGRSSGRNNYSSYDSYGGDYSSSSGTGGMGTTTNIYNSSYDD